MKNSTLKIASGLILLIVAVFIAVQNFKNQPETSQKKVSSVVVKTPHKSRISKEKKETLEPEEVTVQFGLKPKFGSKPTTETE